MAKHIENIQGVLDCVNAKPNNRKIAKSDPHIPLMYFLSYIYKLAINPKHKNVAKLFGCAKFAYGLPPGTKSMIKTLPVFIINHWLNWIPTETIQAKRMR